VKQGAQNKAKGNVFLMHGSQWKAGSMPRIACWNTFFLFSLKELALFPIHICPLTHPFIHTPTGWIYLHSSSTNKNLRIYNKTNIGSKGRKGYIYRMTN